MTTECRQNSFVVTHRAIWFRALILIGAAQVCWSQNIPSTYMQVNHFRSNRDSLESFVDNLPEIWESSKDVRNLCWRNTVFRCKNQIVAVVAQRLITSRKMTPFPEIFSTVNSRHKSTENRLYRCKS